MEPVTCVICGRDATECECPGKRIQADFERLQSELEQTEAKLAEAKKHIKEPEGAWLERIALGNKLLDEAECKLETTQKELTEARNEQNYYFRKWEQSQRVLSKARRADIYLRALNEIIDYEDDVGGGVMDRPWHIAHEAIADGESPTQNQGGKQMKTEFTILEDVVTTYVELRKTVERVAELECANSAANETECGDCYSCRARRALKPEGE